MNYKKLALSFSAFCITGLYTMICSRVSLADRSGPCTYKAIYPSIKGSLNDPTKCDVTCSYTLDPSNLLDVQCPPRTSGTIVSTCTTPKSFKTQVKSGAGSSCSFAQIIPGTCPDKTSGTFTESCLPTGSRNPAQNYDNP